MRNKVLAMFTGHKNIFQEKYGFLFLYLLVLSISSVIYFVLKVKVKSLMCPILCNPVDCSPPGSSVHGILQARILEWVAISFSRGCSQPRDQTQVSHIVGRYFLPSEPPGKSLVIPVKSNPCSYGLKTQT